MKILHVVTSMLVGGAERLLTQIAPMMRSAGHQCDIVLFNGVDSQFKRSLLANKITVIDFSIGGGVYNPIYIYRLHKIVNKYDIVHTHCSSPQLFTAIANVGRGATLVTTEHNTFNRRRKLWCYRPIDKWMYGMYDAIIAISPATADELKALVPSQSKIRTIPNGIDIKRFANAIAVSRKELGVKENSTVIAMVAAFRAQKDQDTIIRAIKLLPENYEAVFVGDGNRIEICRSIAKELGIASRVHFIGVRPDVDRVFKAVDIVVLSSHWEGFGLAAVEGMAAGKPLIASDVPGLADVVNGAGILFTPSNEMDLAKKIQEISANEELRGSVVEKCRRRAMEYDISIMVNSYLELYKKLKEK